MVNYTRCAVYPACAMHHFKLPYVCVIHYFVNSELHKLRNLLYVCNSLFYKE